MNIEVVVNDYLLAWYLLYGASISKEIDKFKKSLYTKYRKEYNLCYKDRNEIIKYGKDFIPDNDIIYNAVLESSLYKTLKKEVSRHRLHIAKIMEQSSNEIEDYINAILKFPYPKTVYFYIIHPRLEVTEYLKDYHALIWGSEKDKYDVLTVMLLSITRSLLYEEHDDSIYNELLKAVLELSIKNEIGSRMGNSKAYSIGDPSVSLIKMQLYPYWLMYLGLTSKEDILNRMINDRVAFDINKIEIDKNLKKYSLNKFLEYCYDNRKKILSLNNVKIIQDVPLEDEYL